MSGAGTVFASGLKVLLLELGETVALLFPTEGVADAGAEGRSGVDINSKFVIFMIDPRGKAIDITDNNINRNCIFVIKNVY